MFKTKTKTTEKPVSTHNIYNDCAIKLAIKAATDNFSPKERLLLAEAAKVLAETRIIMASAKNLEEDL